ncbi:hypothetical protein HDU85_003781 [Gaertneriomyces sp. JEL0708]|nr:hypothetical protein HDU85_003781 [Gaertneriomyces sp. JEL0708]
MEVQPIAHIPDVLDATIEQMSWASWRSIWSKEPHTVECDVKTAPKVGPTGGRGRDLTSSVGEAGSERQGHVQTRLRENYHRRIVEVHAGVSRVKSHTVDNTDMMTMIREKASKSDIQSETRNKHDSAVLHRIRNRDHPAPVPLPKSAHSARFTNNSGSSRRLPEKELKLNDSGHARFIRANQAGQNRSGIDQPRPARTTSLPLADSTSLQQLRAIVSQQEDASRTSQAPHSLPNWFSSMKRKKKPRTDSREVWSRQSQDGHKSAPTPAGALQHLVENIYKNHPDLSFVLPILTIDDWEAINKLLVRDIRQVAEQKLENLADNLYEETWERNLTSVYEKARTEGGGNGFC